MTLKFAYLNIFILLCTSCVEMLPDQFSPDDVKQDQIFSIEQLTQAKCSIKTLEPVEPGSFISQAQKIVLESNRADSVVFSDSSTVHPVINNLPVVKYEVGGGPAFCRTLLNQKDIRLTALPHSSYDVYFQITGAHLKVLMSGGLYELPYQNLSQAIPLENGQYAIPLGGYALQQGQVRNRLNVDHQKTHILDFFPNEESLQTVQGRAGIPQKIRESAGQIYIPELSSGFFPFKYQEKLDVLPKAYFEGVWYSGVSVVSTKILSNNRLVGSGYVLSGDSYSKYTPGQKVSFKFESGRLTAVNEHYRKQSDDLDSPVSAEALSIPVKHFDYRNTLSAVFPEEGLEEPLNNSLSWKDKRYVSLNFSQVDDFHNKRMRSIIRRYSEDSLESAEQAVSRPVVTVKELRFAPNYFDFIIDDGAMEYRFSFFKKDPSNKSAYQPKTMSKADPRFEFFSLRYNRIFPDPVQSFREDYEDHVRLLKVHPNDQGRVPIHFSNATPQDDLIRSIGREAVSLWNQALSMAGISWRLYLDETKDVNIGDNRYHILNMPNERNRRYAGVAQFYADPETGELIATTSNTVMPDIKAMLEQTVISYAYEKYDLLNPLRHTSVSYPVSIGKSFIFHPKEKIDLSYSMENLRYLMFDSYIRRLSEASFLKAPRSFNEARSYFEQIAQQRNEMNPLISRSFSNYFTDASPELKDWLRNFKIAYALKQGRFMEDDPFDQIQNNVRHWGLEDRRGYAEHDSTLTRILDQVCHDMQNPVLDRDVFEVSVKSCVQKIFPIYALGVTVHELGHSLFSLRHNFAASTDYKLHRNKGRKYQIKHLAPYLTYTNAKGDSARVDSWFNNNISSSVMDYIRFSDGEQWGPGAYDIAAIHFLFDGDQKKAEELNVKEVIGFLRPHNKERLDRDHFKRCSDGDLGSSAYCLAHDRGSKPEEIAFNEVKSLFSVMDQYFYNQDRFFPNSAFYSSIFRKIWNLMVIYQDWRKRLDDYSRRRFNTTIERLNKSQSDELFSKFLSSGLGKTKQERELLSFYKARNLIYHTLSYLAFLPNRYCLLQKDWSSYEKKRWKPDSSYILLELSKVISAEYSLNEDQQIYPLLSCWKDSAQMEPHPAVTQYIEQHYPDYSLSKEIGHFLNFHSLPQSAPYKKFHGYPHKASYPIRFMAFSALTLAQAFFPIPLANGAPVVSMMEEKDIQQGVERLLLARMTRGVFYPVSKFFKSFDPSKLQHLHPERSAKHLFGFPLIEDKKWDLVFKDEFIQLNQLTPRYEISPQARTDQYSSGSGFYQNFSEEKRLLNLFSRLYSTAYIVSGGLSNDSMSERAVETSSNFRVAKHLQTSNLLAEKALNYGMYRHYPHLSILYYFELGGFLVLPNLNISLNSFGNQILSELAKNSARMLWTKPYKKLFEGENIYTSASDLKEGGFGYHLYNYLSGFLSRFQHTRLGRFYFIYAYSLVLNLLDGYEQALTLSESSSREFHKQALSSSRLLEHTVLSLFGFSYCNVPRAFEEFQRNIEHNARMRREVVRTKDGKQQVKWVPEEVFEDISDQAAYRREFEQWLFDNCSIDSSEKGKMHRLFIREEQLLNRARAFGFNNFILDSPYIQMPPVFKSLLKNRLDVSTERFQNERLRRNVRNLENYLAAKGGMAGIHTAVKMLFQMTFPPFLEDTRLVRQWIQSNRQLLIDIIPKLMLMYSEDRSFVGEFMLLTSVMHRFCSNTQTSPSRCRLAIEKFVGHYFRGSDYESDPRLDFFFNVMFDGRMRIKDFSNNEIPWPILFTPSPKDYQDRNITPLVLEIEPISDYLFYERGWDAMHSDMEELTAQRDLLFTVLPLGNLRFLDSSNFVLSNRADLFRENE